MRTQKKEFQPGELFQTFLGGDLIKRMWEIKREDCRSQALYNVGGVGPGGQLKRMTVLDKSPGWRPSAY